MWSLMTLGKKSIRLIKKTKKKPFLSMTWKKWKVKVNTWIKKKLYLPREIGENSGLPIWQDLIGKIYQQFYYWLQQSYGVKEVILQRNFLLGNKYTDKAIVEALLPKHTRSNICGGY